MNRSNSFFSNCNFVMQSIPFFKSHFVLVWFSYHIYILKMEFDMSNSARSQYWIIGKLKPYKILQVWLQIYILKCSCLLHISNFKMMYIAFYFTTRRRKLYFWRYRIYSFYFHMVHQDPYNTWEDHPSIATCRQNIFKWHWGWSCHKTICNAIFGILMMWKLPSGPEVQRDEGRIPEKNTSLLKVMK